MLEWLRDLFGGGEDRSQVKDFDEIMSRIGVAEYQKLGLQSIPTDQIIGSVGRAHELDANFHYRTRAATARYHRLSEFLAEGRPIDPIKVLKVVYPSGKIEYYVVDGHHRVAQAKQSGFAEMNADVTEAVLKTQTG
jgi:uncharacterized ParB-like nuclease family protein